MDLSSQEVIRNLIAAHASGKQARHRVVKSVSQGERKTRCRCGQCRQCLDDARWNRIFAEKFADPDYYTGPVTRVVSPLTSM